MSIIIWILWGMFLFPLSPFNDCNTCKADGISSDPTDVFELVKL